MWRGELKELARIIRAHPRFPPANQHFVSEYVAYREEIRVLNKVISNLARERMLEHLVYLHYSRKPSEPGSGATFERLAALSNSRDQIGERSVRTGLRLAQVTGLVALTRSRADARLRIYEPTEPLIEMI